MNNGQTKPGYNLQIGTENQFITDFGFFHNPNDTGTMIPFLTSFSDRYRHMPKECCADSGYGSEENYSFMEASGIEAYVKYNYFHREQKRDFRQDIFRMENLYYSAWRTCTITKRRTTSSARWDNTWKWSASGMTGQSVAIGRLAPYTGRRDVRNVRSGGDAIGVSKATGRWKSTTS